MGLGGGKRTERPVRLMVQWHGRTIAGRREIVCWMCVYGMEHLQRCAVSLVVSEIDIARAGGAASVARVVAMIEQRYRFQWSRLRAAWRDTVLGVGWKDRRAERYRAKFMEGWKAGGKLECSFCGGLHFFDRSLRGDGVVRWTCEGRILEQPSFTVKLLKPDLA